VKKYIYKIAIYPVRWYWFLFRPNGYGVKVLIKRDDGKLLFIRNTYGKGWWNFPGGGKIKGESSEQAAKREVQEEVGLVLEKLQLLGSFVSTLEYKKDHIDVFLAHTNDPIGKTDTGEISEVQWFGVDDLPQPLARVAQRSVDLLREKS
jgi:8-oxo-dGTP pyrophosphatase MutT (NUDIX family)